MRRPADQAVHPTLAHLATPAPRPTPVRLVIGPDNQALVAATGPCGTVRTHEGAQPGALSGTIRRRQPVAFEISAYRCHLRWKNAGRTPRVLSL
jgi:hypothetical protein